MRYVVYDLTIKGTKNLSSIGYDMLNKKRWLHTQLVENINVGPIIIYIGSIVILLSNNEKIFSEDFLLLFIAYLIIQYPELVSNILYVTFKIKMFIEALFINNASIQMSNNSYHYGMLT